METGSAPFRQGMTEHEAQQTKVCMYCGQQRPLSEFRRRTGKRAGPGSRRGACRGCRQRSGQADVSDILVQGQSRQARTQRPERITDEPSAPAKQPVTHESADGGSDQQDTQAEPLSSASSESSGERKKRRRRRKSKRQQAQPGPEQSERITETSAAAQADRDPCNDVRTLSNVRTEQVAARAAVAAGEASLPENPQDPAAGTAAAGQQTAAGRKRKRRRKRSAPPGAGTGPDRIAVKSDVPASDRGAAATVDVPLAAAAQPAAPGVDPGQAADAAAGTAESSPCGHRVRKGARPGLCAKNVCIRPPVKTVPGQRLPGTGPIPTMPAAEVRVQMAGRAARLRRSRPPLIRKIRLPFGRTGRAWYACVGKRIKAAAGIRRLTWSLRSHW